MTIGSSKKGRLAKGLLLATVAAVSLSSEALAQEAQHRFNIPAQDATTALQAYAKQSGKQVLFSYDAVKGRKTPAVKGDLSDEAALSRLIAGTGLQVTSSDQSTVTLAPASEGNALAGGPNAGNNSASSSGEEFARGSENGVAEILVIGRKTLNTDIRRTADDVQPYVIFDSQDIRRSGAYSVEDFLNTRLPMNAQTRTSLQSSGDLFVANQGQINLRGIGSNQTLVLVDGRRVAGVATGNSFEQPSLSGIPPAAIERIEILPSTAGAIYGGSATGGVVNVVLKREYSGIEVDGSYGNTFRNDYGTRHISALGGLTFGGGSTRIMGSLSYGREGILYDADRSFTPKSRALLLTNNPDSFSVPFITGTTTNVVSADGSDLVLDNGTALGSKVTSVPFGYRGPGTDAGLALVSNAGHLNLASAGGTPLLQAPTNYSAGLTIRQKLASSIEAFADLSYSKSKDDSSFPQVLRTTLSADSPDNPFQQDVQVNIPLSNFSSLTHAEDKTFDARIGTVFSLLRRWTGTLEYDFSRNTSKVVSNGNAGTTDEGEAQIEAQALQDLIAFPISNVDALFLLSRDSTTAKTALESLSLRFGGPLFKLPGGDFSVNGLLEGRKQTADDIFSVSEIPALAETSINWSPRAWEKGRIAYLEVHAPIVGGAHTLPLIHEFELLGSIRYGDYRTSTALNQSIDSVDDLPHVDRTIKNFGSTDYLVGFRYMPISSLALRASYATGFLPPSLGQLVTGTFNRQASRFTEKDPKRGGTRLVGNSTGNIDTGFGGDPTLDPERSRSYSIGLVFKPKLFEGLRFSLDYTHISKTNEIASVSRQYIIDHEDLYPGRIQRAAPLPGDPPDWAGPITYIGSTIVNLNRSTVEALDIQASYELETRSLGTFHFDALATRQLKFARQPAALSPLVDSIGYSDGPLRWRANFGAQWDIGPFELAWAAQYYAPYHVYRSDEDDPSIAEEILDQGAANIPAQRYHDLSVTYTLANNGPIPGAQLSLSVQNIFDHSPPIINYEAGVYSTYGDPRLRRFLVSLRAPLGRSRR